MGSAPPNTTFSPARIDTTLAAATYAPFISITAIYITLIIILATTLVTADLAAPIATTPAAATLTAFVATTAITTILIIIFAIVIAAASLTASAVGCARAACQHRRRDLQ